MSFALPRKACEYWLEETLVEVRYYSWDNATQIAEEAYNEADDCIQPPYGSVLLKGVQDTWQLKKHRLMIMSYSH